MAGGTILAWTSPALPQLTPLITNATALARNGSLSGNSSQLVNSLNQTADFLLDTKDSKWNNCFFFWTSEDLVADELRILLDSLDTTLTGKGR